MVAAELQNSLEETDLHPFQSGFGIWPALRESLRTGDLRIEGGSVSIAPSWISQQLLISLSMVAISNLDVGQSL